MPPRTALLLALALLLPPVLTLGWMAAWDQHWWVVRWIGQFDYGSWTVLGLFVLAGATCLFRLEWSLSTRISLIAVYAPVMIVGLLYMALVASCVLFHDCI